MKSTHLRAVFGRSGASTRRSGYFRGYRANSREPGAADATTCDARNVDLARAFRTSSSHARRQNARPSRASPSSNGLGFVGRRDSNSEPSDATDASSRTRTRRESRDDPGGASSTSSRCSSSSRDFARFASASHLTTTRSVGATRRRRRGGVARAPPRRERLRRRRRRSPHRRVSARGTRGPRGRRVARTRGPGAWRERRRRNGGRRPGRGLGRDPPRAP